MPEGSEGNMPSGLLIPFLNSSQKQRGHSFNVDSELGENLYGMEEMKARGV
jgi:hypothetical protein